jgi:hypothetical protein
MGGRNSDKDLFGKRIRHNRPRYEAALERNDKASVPIRAVRARWLRKRIPKKIAFWMPMETGFVFGEAAACFVDGHFVATIMLAASFVDHWLTSGLAHRGYGNEAKRGLEATIKVAKKKKLVDPFLLDAVNKLRLIRNPFAHLKLTDSDYKIGSRAVQMREPPEVLLEKDAKEAIIAMYGVAMYAFGRNA